MRPIGLIGPIGSYNNAGDFDSGRRYFGTTEATSVETRRLFTNHRLLMLFLHHLGRDSLRRRSLSRRLLAITPIESIHASGRINQLLLAGKERMAGGTDFHMQLAFTRRSRLESLAARAGHGYFAILRMNSGFHFLLTLYSCQLVTLLKQPMIRSYGCVVKPPVRNGMMRFPSRIVCLVATLGLV